MLGPAQPRHLNQPIATSLDESVPPMPASECMTRSMASGSDLRLDSRHAEHGDLRSMGKSLTRQDTPSPPGPRSSVV